MNSQAFPYLQFDKIVLYDYIPADMTDCIVGKNGHLTPEAQILESVTLSANDPLVIELGKKLDDPASYGEDLMRCFTPYLGIVYYLNDKIVAHISLCITCNHLRSSINIQAIDQSEMRGFSKSFRQYLYTLAERFQFTKRIYELDVEFKMLSKEETGKAREELKMLCAVAYYSHASSLSPDNALAMRQNILKNEMWDVLLSNSICFVCMAGGKKLVGCAFLIPSGNPWRFFEADWAYLRMVGVLPDFGGQGIAKQLTQMCIAHAKQSGEKILALHTSEFMDAARHIYEKAGFTKLRELEKAWDKRYWLYTLNL